MVEQRTSKKRYFVILVEEERLLANSLIRRIQSSFEECGETVYVLHAENQTSLTSFFLVRDIPEIDVVVMTASVPFSQEDPPVARSVMNTGMLVIVVRDLCDATIVGASFNPHHRQALLDAGCHEVLSDKGDIPERLVKLLLPTLV